MTAAFVRGRDRGDPTRAGSVVTEHRHTPLKIAVPFLLVVLIPSGLFLVSLDGETKTEVQEDPDGTGSFEPEVVERQTVNSSSDSDQAGETESTDIPELDESRVETLVLESVNDRRAENGAPELREVEELADTARNHSRNMSEAGYIGHVDPAGTDVIRYQENCRTLSGFGNLSYFENLARTWYGKEVETADGGDPPWSSRRTKSWRTS